MTDPYPRTAELRLHQALAGLAVAFRGATALPDEYNCDCHWGSAEELALLKAPDLELDPDLLRRTWDAPDWNDHASVLRRILPQLAVAVVDSRSESFEYQAEIGRSLARGHWREWPPGQAGAVWEFLHAFWARSLVAPDGVADPCATLVLCAEASGELGPWLDVWEALEHPVADRNLAEAVDRWDYDLFVDQLPWSSWHDAEVFRAVLTAWLTRHAPARLKARNAPDDLLHRLRLLGLTGAARWTDPHSPDYRY